MEKSLFLFSGESYSLLAAFFWAIAVIFFKKSGETYDPLQLNLFKTVFAALIFFVTLFFIGQPFIIEAPFRIYSLLFLSGAIGIGISDTLFLKSLNLLGASLSAIVDCLYSPFVIFLSLLFLKETLTLTQVLGTFLIISAVFTISFEQSKDKKDKKTIFYGILYGILAMFTVAIGIVMIKPVLVSYPVIWSTEIRIIGGIAALLIITIFKKPQDRTFWKIMNRKNLFYALSGSLFGTYLSMIFWIAGMKFTTASISAVLNQTSNVFVFILASFFLKEPINKRRIFAIFTAISGAMIIVL